MSSSTGVIRCSPVFEFDACFDPKGDTTATGTVFESVLNVASTSLPRRPDGTVDVQLVCGTGAHGCGGTIAASAGSTDPGRFSYDLREEQAATIRVPCRFLPTLWKSPSHSSRRRASFRPSR